MYTNLFIIVCFITFYTVLFIGVDKVIHKMNWDDILYSRGVIIFFIITYEIFSPFIIDEFKQSFFLHYNKAVFFTKVIYALWISLVSYTVKNFIEVKKINNLSFKVCLSSIVLIIGDWIFSS